LLYYAGKNKTLHYEQNESFAEERQDEHNVSSARGKRAKHSEHLAKGKRKTKKQNEHDVSSALPDVKIRLQSAVGKQSDRMFIVDSGTSFQQI
jgi:hypothetical protein